MHANTDRMLPRYGAHWDGLGVFLSGVCLVHCLLLPVIIGLFPLAGIGFLDHQQFHQLLLFLVLPVSVVGFGLGYRRHHRRYILFVGTGGIAILVFVALFAHDLMISTGEIILASLGGTVVAVAHILNFLEARKTECPAAEGGINAG